MELGKIIKTVKTKKGSTAVIRWIEWSDLDNLLSYANDLVAEDTFVMLSGDPLTRDEELSYLSDSISSIERGRKIHLVGLVDGDFAGCAEVRRFDKRKSHVGEIGISLGEKYRDLGLGSELMKALIDESRRMGLRLLVLHCFETNKRAIHVYENMGFKKAGTVPGTYQYKGDYFGEDTMYLLLT